MGHYTHIYLFSGTCFFMFESNYCKYNTRQSTLQSFPISL